MYCFSGQWQWMVLPQCLVDTYTHQMERNINSLFMASLWLGMCKEVRNRVLPKLCVCSKNEQPFDIGRKKVASATRISCTLVLRWKTLTLYVCVGCIGFGKTQFSWTPCRLRGNLQFICKNLCQCSYKTIHYEFSYRCYKKMYPLVKTSKITCH